jgi:hypothetical protein
LTDQVACLDGAGVDLLGQSGQQGVFHDGAFAVFQQDVLVGDLLGQAATELGDGGGAFGVGDAGEDDVAVRFPLQVVALVGFRERVFEVGQGGRDLRGGGLENVLGGTAAVGGGIDGVQELDRGGRQGAAGGVIRGQLRWVCGELGDHHALTGVQGVSVGASNRRSRSGRVYGSRPAVVRSCSSRAVVRASLMCSTAFSAVVRRVCCA